MAQTQQDELLGMTLGRSVIEELLGQGGMARVYRAHQEHLDREVAVKVLPPYYAADPAFVERFKLEAKAMARLSHPNIVPVHDAGEEHGLLYIVMEYISGGTLRQRMTKQMSAKDVERVIGEMASALTYAHAQGIVHRDVKPVNVLMDPSGRSVLSDFGIAKVMATSLVVTGSGAGVGTPEYMSPEQCKGAPVDARADIYALGVMLYEMLTGHTPFEADNYTALAHSHIYEQPIPPSQRNPRVSPAVQSVVMKALAKDPADRFQEANEMAEALEMAFEAQRPVALPPRPAPRLAPGVICPNCQAANAPHQRFCTTCGAPLANLAVQPAVYSPYSPPVAPGPYAPPAHPHPQPDGASVLCPTCHAPNQARNRFCTTCGQSLLVGVAGHACKRCGAQNSAGQRFCTTCGAPLR